MDSLIEAVEPQVVLVVAAVTLLFLSVVLLVRIVKATAGLILVIAAIVLVTNYLFGISPNQLLNEIVSLPQEAIQLVKGFDFTALTSMLQG